MRNERWFLLMLLMLAALCPATRADDAAEARAVRDFKGVRVLVWGFDQGTGKVAGFSDAQLLTGTMLVEPASGFRFSISARKVEQLRTTDFVHESSRSIIPLTIVSRGRPYERQQFLTEPDVQIETGLQNRLDVVLLTVPIGSVQSPMLSKKLEDKPQGTAADLEDLLIAMAKDEQLRPQSLMDAYLVLKTSQRLEQWVAMRKDTRAKGARLALIAAARLLDPQSLQLFCERCLTTSGNEQLEFADRLYEMPPHARVLETMLRMTILPQPLIRATPDGVAAAGMDRRFTMSLPIVAGYTNQQITDQARLIVEGSSAQDKPRVAQRMAEVLKQVDQLRTPPATNSSISERLRLRREGEAATQPAGHP